jgi:predicted DNA-binding protein (MmcQ/YjbR family)
MRPAALRKLLSAWPGVTEDVKWCNDLVSSVGGRMFCVTDARDGGALGFEVDAGRFLELTDRPGIVPAPYLARAQWVQLADDALQASELRALLRRSYELVRAKLSKKLQHEHAG